MKARAIKRRIELHKRFLRDMGNSIVSHTDVSMWPFVFSITEPIPMTFALYIYDNKNPAGGRPNLEYKFNIYVPGQKRGQYSSFDYTEGFPLMVSYSEDYDVYIIYDAEKHTNFKWCANIQSRLEFILDACGGNIATFVKKNNEVLIGITGQHLLEGIIKRLNT